MTRVTTIDDDDDDTDEIVMVLCAATSLDNDLENYQILQHVSTKTATED